MYTCIGSYVHTVSTLIIIKIIADSRHQCLNHGACIVNKKQEALQSLVSHHFLGISPLIFCAWLILLCLIQMSLRYNVHLSCPLIFNYSVRNNVCSHISNNNSVSFCKGVNYSWHSNFALGTAWKHKDIHCLQAFALVYAEFDG